MPWPGWAKIIFPVRAAASASSSDSSSSGADDLPDYLTCGICHDLVTGATQTPCCGGLSCKACIEAVAATTVVCPYCRARALAPGKVHPDVRVERLAAHFVRACKHAGCDLKAQRDELVAHEPTCCHRPTHEVIAELCAEIEALRDENEARRNGEEVLRDENEVLRDENEVLAEVGNQWRHRRCLTIAVIWSQVVMDPNGWTVTTRTHLELLSCRVHAFDELESPTAAPRVTHSVVHPPRPPHLKLMPRTRAELHNFAVGVAPVIKLSHIEDQAEPTTCYIIKSCAPRSARQVTIPAKASEAVCVTGLLTEEDAAGRAVNVYLAETLGDFGLGPDGNYADPGVAQKY